MLLSMIHDENKQAREPGDGPRALRRLGILGAYFSNTIFRVATKSPVAMRYRYTPLASD